MPRRSTPICHVSRLTNDQQIAYEQWPLKWRKLFERRTDALIHPYVTTKTRAVFDGILDEMGKSGELIGERLAATA
jgi:hypothetical protein